jgi:hypothetical protein
VTQPLSFAASVGAAHLDYLDHLQPEYPQTSLQWLSHFEHGACNGFDASTFSTQAAATARRRHIMEELHQEPQGPNVAVLICCTAELTQAGFIIPCH